MTSMKSLVFWGLVQMSMCFPFEEYFSRDVVARLTPYQVKQRSNFIEEKIKELVENLKGQMKDGAPEMGIPPLDPLSLGNHSLGPLNLGSAGTIDVADFKALKVYGLPDFEMSGIKMNLFSLTLFLNLTFSHVRAEGRYALDGNLLGFVPIYGNGPFHVEASDVLISSKSKLKVGNGKLSLQTLDLSLEVGHVHIHFEELLGGGDLGDELNGILQSTGQVLIKQFGPTIGNFFSEFARTKLNDALQHIDFGNIIG